MIDIDRQEFCVPKWRADRDRPNEQYDNYIHSHPDLKRPYSGFLDHNLVFQFPPSGGQKQKDHFFGVLTKIWFLSSWHHCRPWLREIDLPSPSYAKQRYATRARARSKRPTPPRGYCTKTDFLAMLPHRRRADILETILHRARVYRSVEAGSREGLPFP